MVQDEQQLTGVVETEPTVLYNKPDYPFTFTMTLDNGILAEVFVSRSMFHKNRELFEVGNKLCLIGSEVAKSITFVADKVR